MSDSGCQDVVQYPHAAMIESSSIRHQASGMVRKERPIVLSSRMELSFSAL